MGYGRVGCESVSCAEEAGARVVSCRVVSRCETGRVCKELEGSRRMTE